MPTNQTNQLVLKSINQLFEYSFFIPAYQRGYRWTNTQVIQLLDDVWNFAKNPPPKADSKIEPFYCLQPIVVKQQSDNKWEVIDGQQRLTSILLILHYFNEMWIGKQKIKEPVISYETRLNSAQFISSLEIDIDELDIELDVESAINEIKINSDFSTNDNIDFHHIANAYKAIHFWVKRMGNNLDNNKLQSIFQNNTKVIWYEVEETENNNSIDIFTRLNIGKIPLTNAELIKALFLQKGNFAEEKATLKQIQIASEWDNIEKTLQDKAFWLFIYNPNNPLKYDNRIEYIFDLIKGRTKDSEYYHTFNQFYKDFSTNLKNEKPDIDKLWLEIKRYFLTFEEWYKNYLLFHHVGYLIECGISINTIKNHSSGKNKDDFKTYLRDEIRKQIDCNIDEIEYGNKSIKKILLLFNIQSVLQTQKSDMRFPFHKYKSENWDIEHICSQTDKDINGKNRLPWVNDILEYFTGTHNLEKAKDIITDIEVNKGIETDILEICNSLVNLKEEEEFKDEKFLYSYKLVQKYFKEDKQTEEKDSISNLALLDSTTNRSYGNSFFPIKRKRIIENDSKGIFVPIATKNLFLKYYSNKLGEVMYWNNNDAKDYMEAIKNTLEDFLPKN